MKRDERRLLALKKALSEVGPFLRGSIQERLMRCGKSGCRCQATSPKLHGPYYEWTRKVNGKTVTIRFTPEQARLLRGWIANARRIDELIADMETVSRRLIQPQLDAAAKPQVRG